MSAWAPEVVYDKRVLSPIIYFSNNGEELERRKESGQEKTMYVNFRKSAINEYYRSRRMQKQLLDVSPKG